MLAASFVTRRWGYGSYLVTDGELEVHVFRFDEGPYRGRWLARARWDEAATSELQPTKRSAVVEARELIKMRRRGEI